MVISLMSIDVSSSRLLVWFPCINALSESLLLCSLVRPALWAASIVAASG